MAEVAVRPATAADRPDLEPIIAAAVEHLSRLRGATELLAAIGVPGDVSAPALTSALCAASLPRTTTLVATVDGSLVGAALLERTPDGVDLLGLHTVAPMRRQRVATALLRAARAVADADGARLEAVALPGDQSTKSLLESAGYKARLLRMSADR